MTEVISKTGLYHRRRGQPNQDCALWGHRDALWGIFLADGMSDSPHSEEGARIACESLKKLLLEGKTPLSSLPGEEAARLIVDQVGQDLRRTAATEGHDWEDYSSTLSAALWNRQTGNLLTVNLGDCLIGGIGGGKLRILSQPGDSREGCCGTTTACARKQLRLGTLDARDLEQIFLCTDGAWRLMFRNSRPKPEVLDALRQETGLIRFLVEQNNWDDCTLITLNINTREE